MADEESGGRDDERLPLINGSTAQQERQSSARPATAGQPPAAAAGDAATRGTGNGSASSSSVGSLLTAFWNNGISCVFASALCFSAAGALVKVLEAMHPRFPVFEIVFVRALLSGLTTSAACRLKGIPVFGTRGEGGVPLPLLIARGVVGAAAMTCSYEGIVRLPLAESTVIFFLSPAITSIFAWLLLGEAFGWLTTAGCLASLAGVVLVSQPPWLLPGGPAAGWSATRTLGFVFAFAGAVLASGAYICIRQIGKRAHPLSIAMYFHLAALLSSAVPLAAGYPRPAVRPSPRECGVLLGIAAGSFGGNLLVNRAFQIELAARASAVNFMQVVFAYVLGAVCFHDPITPLGLAGAAMIGAGVVTVSLDTTAQRRKASVEPLPEQGSAAEDGGAAWQQQGAAPGVPPRWGGRQLDQLQLDSLGQLTSRATGPWAEAELAPLAPSSACSERGRGQARLGPESETRLAAGRPERSLWLAKEPAAPPAM